MKKPALTCSDEDSLMFWEPSSTFQTLGFGLGFASQAFIVACSKLASLHDSRDGFGLHRQASLSLKGSRTSLISDINALSSIKHHPSSRATSQLHEVSIPHAPSYPSSKSLKSERGVESICSRSILSSKSSNLGLCILAKCDSGFVGATDVGELIANTVGDDVGVQSILLALGDGCIGRQECSLCSFSASAAELEVDCGGAGYEVSIFFEWKNQGSVIRTKNRSQHRLV